MQRVSAHSALICYGRAAIAAGQLQGGGGGNPEADHVVIAAFEPRPAQASLSSQPLTADTITRYHPPGCGQVQILLTAAVVRLALGMLHPQSDPVPSATLPAAIR